MDAHSQRQPSPAVGPTHIGESRERRSALIRQTKQIRRDSVAITGAAHVATVGFVATVAVALAIYLAALSVVPNCFISDDTDQLVFSQSLEGGYHEQPPLYSWLTWAVFRAIGPTRFAFALIKTLVLGSIYLALYCCARAVLGKPSLASLAAGSAVLIPAFAWNSTAYLTHSNLACTIGAATVWALIRVVRAGQLRDYALLGLFLGLGTLSKYNYLVFAGSLLAAGLTIRAYRPRLANWRILLTLAVALLVVSPHAYWVVNHWATMKELGAIKAKLTAELRPAGGAAMGIAQLAMNIFVLCAPVVLVLAHCAPGAFRSIGYEVSTTADVHRLFKRFFLIALACFVVMIIATNAAHFHERWLQPFVLLLPIYLLGRMPLAKTGAPAKWKQLAFAEIAAAVLLIGVWAAQVAVASREFGGYSPLSSFQAAAERVERELEGGNTVISADRTIAANLRYLLPDVRHVCGSHALYQPPGERLGRAVVIWNVTEGKKRPPQYLKEFAADRLHLRFPRPPIVRLVELTDRVSGRVLGRLAYLVMNSPQATPGP